MNDRRVKNWLGGEGPDAGCEACFEDLDRYAEAMLRGEAAAERFPEVHAHLASCVACLEDYEGLLAVLSEDGSQEIE